MLRLQSGDSKIKNNLWNVVVSSKNQSINKVMPSVTARFKNWNLKIQEHANYKLHINFILQKTTLVKNV